MTVDIVEILKLIPNYGISVFVIWIGFQLFREITAQIKEINVTLAQLVILVKTIRREDRP